MKPEELAIEFIEELDKRSDIEELKRKIRTRCRQNYTDLYYLGASYVIALSAARAGNKEVIINGLLSPDCKGIIEKIVNERSMSSEEKSYALYTTILLYYIKDSLKDKKFGEIIKTLRQNDLLFTAKLIPLADWLKKLSEAYFKQE